MESALTFKGKPVKILCALICAALLGASGEAGAQENAYDLLGRVLRPYVNIVARRTKDPNRALSLSLQIEEMTGRPPELAAGRLEIDLQYPDKLRLHAPVLGHNLTIVRDGQNVWVHPGRKVEALMQAASASKDLPPLNPKFRLESFRLPVPEKQLVFLPMLFQVRDAGGEEVGGERCRVLDLTLMPELAKSLDETAWAARLWVRPNASLARLTLTRAGWTAIVRFEQVKFSRSLPKSTWTPTPVEKEDVLQISPERYDQLLRSFGRH